MHTLEQSVTVQNSGVVRWSAWSPCLSVTWMESQALSSFSPRRGDRGFPAQAWPAEARPERTAMLWSSEALSRLEILAFRRVTSDSYDETNPTVDFAYVTLMGPTLCCGACDEGGDLSVRSYLYEQGLVGAL